MSVTGVNPNALIRVYRFNGTEFAYQGLMGAESDGTLTRSGFAPGEYYVTQLNQDASEESAPSDTVIVNAPQL